MPWARPQAKATTRPQQWLQASLRPQQWLVIGVQGCRLTGFKRLTPKMPRRPFACIALCRSSVHASGTPAGKSHHKATAMAQGIPPAIAMACYRRSRLPFDRLQTLKTSKMPRRPFACIALCRSSVHASGTPRPKATTRPQQWLKASPRPQQWLLIGVQGCRLTGFKRLKPLKCPSGRLPA